MKIKNDSGMLCVLVDPDGHVRWLSNNSLAGRQYFGSVKNDLVVCTFVRGKSVSFRVPTGFNSDIDYIGAVHGNSVNLVTVYSVKEGRYSIIDFNERVVVESGKHTFSSDFKLPYAGASILSPNGKMMAIRHPEDGTRPPLLVVYDVVD